MRADNDGEGGIMALAAIVEPLIFKRPWIRTALIAAALFGVALFLGDGMITPAISVLSAVEGLNVVAPNMNSYVVPIIVVIIAALFYFQKFGTGAIGRFFGPIMLVWFAILAVMGGVQVAKDPAIVRALLPQYAVGFVAQHPSVAFIALGSIVLTITGTEALYADMGHFGRPAIARGWYLVVFPALLLNYLGQGSLILESPTAVANPFFLLVPSWAQITMVILATIATVIASQAVISGAFSVANQAIRRGFLPRLTIRHTSDTERGQVYSPVINWALCAAVIVLVLTFQTSTNLASAYGVAVTGTLLIDTVLFFVVVRMVWKRPLWLTLLGGLFFGAINLAFLTSNLTKIPTGGWFPLAVAAVIFSVLTTWAIGRRRIETERLDAEGSMSDLITEIPQLDPPVQVVPGTATYLNSSGTAPLALQTGVRLNHVIHSHIIIFELDNDSAPHVPEEERLTVSVLGDTPVQFLRLQARIGFRDSTDIPALLALAQQQQLLPDIDVENTLYFLSRITIVEGAQTGIAKWRKRLFILLSRNAADPVDYFGLPADRTVTMGTRLSV